MDVFCQKVSNMQEDEITSFGDMEAEKLTEELDQLGGVPLPSRPRA
jgi:hypothetical protein